MTGRTMSDRLVRLGGRTKREGREVAGVRRLGVFHCHSTIIEAVLGLVQTETNAAESNLIASSNLHAMQLQSQLHHHLRFYKCRKVKPAFDKWQKSASQGIIAIVKILSELLTSSP